MADFDKDLQPIIKPSGYKATNIPIGPGMNFSTPGGGGVADLSQEEDIYSELAAAGQKFSQKGLFISNAELEANKRYKTFNPTIGDYEDFAAQGQEWYKQATNGVLKGANLAATTIAGGFGMLYGVGKSVLFTQKLSDVWDNEITRNLDKWNNYVDNEVLPNYYTAAERNSEWYSTDNWFTTNFLFDKLIKNSGYAVGAMVGGNIANAGLLKLGTKLGGLAAKGATAAEASQSFKLFTPLLRNTARAFSAGKNKEAAALLESKISSIADLSAKASQMANISKQTGQFARFSDAARRTAVATYSSAGEASFEALQTAKEFRENLIDEYKRKNGFEPVGEDLKNINAQAENVGKTSFFGNMALLSITEFNQLPYLIGSKYAASRQAANSLLGKVDDFTMDASGKAIAKAGPTTRFGKLYEGAKRARMYVFDPKESAQEILQYGLQVGTQNYFKKAQEGGEADLFVDGFLYGLFGKDEFGKGVGAFVSKEGIEGGILGGITGGLMQARGNYMEKKALAKNTENFLNMINNAPTFKEAFQERLEAANRGVVLQQQHRDAIINGDRLEERDLFYDQMHNYLAPRIKYGRFDMVMEDLSELKQAGMTERGLAELKEQGMANINDTVDTFQKRINSIENSSKALNELYQSLNIRYAGETTEVNGETIRKYSPIIIDKLAYAGSKIANYDVRLPQLNAKLSGAGINTQAILQDIIETGTPNKEATREALNTINSMDVTSDVKDELKGTLDDVIELSLRRKMFINEYDSIKNNPLNYERPVEEVDEVDVRQKEGRKKVTKTLEVGKTYSLAEPITLEKGKIVLAPKFTVLSSTLGGEFEVQLPDGTTTFFSPEQFDKYNISDEDNTSQELEDILNQSIDEVLDYPVFKGVVEKPGEGVNKLQYINSLGNDRLTKSVINRFNELAKKLLTEKAKEKEVSAKIKEQSSSIDKQQNEVADQPGDVKVEEIPFGTRIDTGETGPLKSADNFFVSSSTASDDPNSELYEKNPPPHVVRSRVFLNNAKRNKKRDKFRAITFTYNQEKDLGLSGVTELSYGLNWATEKEKVNDLIDGFVGQVYVEVDGKNRYFIDQYGNRIKNAEGKDVQVGEQVDLSKVVFETRPTAREYNRGNKDRFRTKEKDRFLANMEVWKKQREILLGNPAKNIPPMAAKDLPTNPFNISKGFPIFTEKVDGKFVKNKVGDTLVTETQIDTQSGLLKISTGTPIVHSGENMDAKPGMVYIQDRDTLQVLNNNLLGAKKAKTVYEVIKSLINEMQTQAEAGKPVQLDRQKLFYLRSVLIYAKHDKDVKSNQLWINIDSMSVQLGNNTYSFKEFLSNEADVVKSFSNVYHSANKRTLDKKEPYFEFIFQEGKLTFRKWSSYQSYLISGKDRSVEDIPFVTNVAKMTDAVPYNYRGKYATLTGFTVGEKNTNFKDPVEKKEEPPAPPAPPTESTTDTDKPSDVKETLPAGKVGGFTVNDGSTNTTEVANLPIEFVASTYADNTIKVDIDLDSEVNKKSIDSLSGMVPEEALNKYRNAIPWIDENTSNEDTLIEIFRYQITVKLQQALKEQQEKQTPPPPAPKAPVSDIEAKKADIEKRRQEEIDKETPIKNENITVDFGGGVSVKYQVITYKDGSVKISTVSERPKRYSRLSDEAFKDYAKIDFESDAKGIIKTELVKDDYTDKESQEIKAAKEKTINAKYDAELIALKGTKSTGTKTPPPSGSSFTINKSLPEFREVPIIKTSDSYESVSNLFKKLKSIKDGYKVILVNDKPFVIQRLLTSLDTITLIPLRESTGSGYTGAGAPQTLKITKRLAGEEYPLEGEYEIDTYLVSQNISEKWPQSTKIDITDISEGDYYKKSETKTPPKEEPTPKQKPKFRSGYDIGNGNKNTRLAAEGETTAERISERDIEAFKAWHAKNAKNIPFEILDHMITINKNEKAWGVFENGVAKFFKKGLRGTEYHEVFEGIWKGFLTENERQALLDEFKNKPGYFLDRESGRQIAFNEATDRQAKERIADDFADFRVGKLPARTLSQRIRNFFNAILEFFKSFVQKPSLKKQLFESIEAGRFRESVLPESIKVAQPEYRKQRVLPDGYILSEDEAWNIVQDMTISISGYLLNRNNDNTVSSIFDLKNVTGTEVYDFIRNKYEEIGNFEFLGESLFNELFLKNVDYLKTVGVSIDVDSLVSVNDSEGNNRLYSPEAFEVDFKKNMKFAIKFLISTQPLLDSTKKDDNGMPLVLNGAAGLPVLANFNRTFATLLSKLSNIPISKIPDRLFDLFKSDAKYFTIIRALGGNMSASDASQLFDFKNFKDDEWRLYIQFVQAFNKSKPDAVVESRSVTQDGVNVISKPAERASAINAEKYSWLSNLKTLATESGSMIKQNKLNFLIDTNHINYPKTLPSTNEARIEFLRNIGINFPAKAITNQKKFMEAFNSIWEYGSKEIANVNKFTKADSHVTKLATMYVDSLNPDHDTTRLNVENKRTGNYSDSNAVSVFEEDFNNVSTLDELFQIRPELKDEFSKNSLLLAKGGRFFDAEGNRTDAELRIGVVDGIMEDDGGTTIPGLTEGQKYTLQINQNIKGNYYILIPADSVTERTYNIGNQIKFKDVNTEIGNSEFLSLMKLYLDDEIELALDWKNREGLASIGEKRAKQLRLFREILSPDLVKEIEDVISTETNTDVARAEIKKIIKDNDKAVDESILETVSYLNNQLDNSLKDNGEVTNNENGTVEYAYLDTDFTESNKIDKRAISEADYNSLLSFVNMNQMIANIELHKFIFGDPYQFEIKNGNLEETKRIKSWLSPRRKTFNSEEANDFLNNEYNKVTEDIVLSETDITRHGFNDFTKTVTLTDPVPQSRYIQSFGNYKESDGFSLIAIGTFREVKWKNGEWPKEAERWYQWQMAYTRQKLSLIKKADGEPVYKYDNPALKNHDENLITKPEPYYVLEVLKPIVSGAKPDMNRIEGVIDKYSQMPLFFKAVEGTHLQDLYTQMLLEDIGYVVYKSGRKEGTRGTHNVYNGNGTFNSTEFDPNTIEEVAWSTYGIQVENTYEEDKQVSRGSQLMKNASMDMFENGKEVIPGAAKLYNDIQKTHDEFHELQYQEFLNKLGIRDLGTSFEIVDAKNVSETLEYELLRRDASENVIDTIRLDENGKFRIPFEASSAYEEIQKVLFSIINKSLLSPSMGGRSYVQVPATLWEDRSKGRKLIRKTGNEETGFTYTEITKKQYEALSPEDKKSVSLASDTLKFYEPGKPYMEIMIPNYWKKYFPGMSDEEVLEHLNKAENQKILFGVGFRIPHQAASSTEIFKIKGFLHPSMGSTVVVPSEIVAKAGSDFDIDKLNMYLKSVYLDENNDVKLIEYKGSKQATIDFYSRVYDEKIKNEVEDVEDSVNFNQNLLEVFEILESVEDPMSMTGEGLKFLLGKKLSKFFTRKQKTINNIIEIASSKNQSPSRYINDKLAKKTERLEKLTEKQFDESMRKDFAELMYKKSLENRYYELLQELVTLPGNFDRLMTPVGDAGLSEVAKELDRARQDEEANVKHKLLSMSFLTSLRHAFLLGKKWVGIAAVNITGHSIAQKINAYIDPKRLGSIDKYDASFLGNMSLAIPHNTVEVNGEKMISLGGRNTVYLKKDKKGNRIIEFISDRLSGYATAFVDVAKDPYIMKILRSDLVVGTAMFMERIGAGELTPFFLNQPIIVDYLKYLDRIGSRALFSNNNISELIAKYPIESGKKYDLKQDFPIDKETGLVDFEKSKANLLSSIDVNNKRDAEFYLKQRAVFDEFLRLAKMAQFSFKFTQAYNYDTTRVRTTEGVLRKALRTQTAEDANIISSVNDVFNQTFIGKQRDMIVKEVKALSSLFKLDSDVFYNVIDQVIKPYALNEYMPLDDFDRIVKKVKTAMIDYLVQNKSDKFTKDVITNLLSGKNNIAKQLTKLQKKYPDNELLSNLEARYSKLEGGSVTVTLKSKPSDAPSVNRYIAMMRELKAIDSKFYNNLVLVSLLQGSYNTRVSISSIVPLEDRSKIIAPLFNRTYSPIDIQNFSNDGVFFRTNFSEESIVPTYSPKFSVHDGGVGYQKSGFIKVEDLGVMPGDGKIIKLSKQYSRFNHSEMDFIKVKRYQYAKGLIIDITNVHKPTSWENFKELVKNGERSKSEIVGYKKVKYSNGEALQDSKGNVYFKMVNLYGDGDIAKIYKIDGLPSSIPNNTFPVQKEFDDLSIINAINANEVLIEETASTIEEPTLPINTIKPTIDLSREWKGDLESMPVYTPEGVNTMRTTSAKPNEHFGNPFSEAGYGDTRKVPSIATAVQAYKDWLLTGYAQWLDNNGEVEEFAGKVEQRQWILDQINQGKLDGAKLLYAGKLAARGEGMHPTALAEVVEQLRKNVQTLTLTPAITEEAVVTPVSEVTTPTTSDKVERTTRMINRSELRKNPKTLYLFGDNDVRKGLGGQAREMRNEPNAIGISTKKLPATSEKSYKTDSELDQNKKIITNDINKVIAAWDSGKYDKLVIPQMGVGLAELPTRAPQTYAFLQQELKRLENYINGTAQQVVRPVSANKFNKKNILSVVPQQGAVDRKAAIKASIATQYIGFGEGIRGSQGQRSSTEIYREQAGQYANTGNYSANDVIFVSIPGKRGAESVRKIQQDKTINEAIKALEAGATILTDNKSYIDSSDYNEGEKRLYKTLLEKGYNYSEITVDGQVIGTWTKSLTPAITEEAVSVDAEEVVTDQYKYYGRFYEIVIDKDGKAIDVVGYKGGKAAKQKLLDAYMANPNVDPQNDKPFRRGQETVEEKQIDGLNRFEFSDGTVINTGNIVLNEQQREALQLAVDAIKRGQTKFVLRGYAGTGKSTISKFIREYLQASNLYKDVKYASPTHKANTNLLIQLIRGKIFNTNPATTAKLLNKRKGESGKFETGPNDQMPWSGVLIIDESSMIDNQDYDLLMGLAKRKGTSIIFMGDPAQLPPVGSSQLSKAMQFSSSEEGMELTQVMRQKGDNPLLDILTNIRQNLTSIVDKFSFKTNINSKGEGVEFTKNYEQFNDKIKEYFSSDEYKEDPTYAKILTYTNASVANYNNIIQAQLGLAPYSAGSIMMGYEQVGQTPNVHNGQDYKILKSDYISDRNVTVFEGSVGNKYFSIQEKVSGYKVQMRRVFSKEDEKLLNETGQTALLQPIDVFIINPNDDRNIKFMERVLAFKKVLNDNTIPWSLRKDALTKFENFFNTYQLPADIINYKGNITTLPKLKQENPELFRVDKTTGKSPFDETSMMDKPMLNKNIDYGYAVTSHKGQGSTYQYIFVDYENMENPANDKMISDNGVKYGNERQQLKYVGLSRASKIAFVYTKKAGSGTLSSNVSEFESIFSKERQEEILTNFAKKHSMSKEEALSYINDAIVKKGKEAVVAQLEKTDELGNKCY